MAKKKLVGWDYGRGLSPNKWKRHPDYDKKATGKKQSPINIVPATARPNPALQPLDLRYKDVGLDNFFFQSLHLEIEVQPEDGGGIGLGPDGEIHTLRQFHLHTPAEHTIGGKYRELELHIVHNAPKGSDYTFLVVGIFFTAKGTVENPFLAHLITKLPSLRVPEPKEALLVARAPETVNVSAAYPADPSYYSYAGSLTTIPCSENVRFCLMKESINVPQAQIEKFAWYVPGGNNRPLQPAHGRKVEQYTVKRSRR